jgi:hypothetical protein
MASMVTAVQIAKEMKLPPKRVRSILRQAGMKHDGRWRFEAAQKTKIKDIVRNARKKASVARPKRKAAAAKVARRPKAESAEATMH